MGDLAGEALWGPPRKPGTGQRPEFGEDIVLDECYILDLAVESGNEAKLGFGTSIFLKKKKRVIFRSRRSSSK